MVITMNYNETFLYAIKDKSSLPKGVTPSFFIGTPYPILEETENKLLTILSGGTVEVPEEFVLPYAAIYQKRLWNAAASKKNISIRSRKSSLSGLQHFP